MVTTLFADVAPLLAALAASDEARVIKETLDLLGGQNVPPAKLAGRVGLAALWGGADPHAVGPLATTGALSEWIRGIPVGTEPAAEDQRRLAPALPLVQGMLGVARWVGVDEKARNDTLPEPLLPAEVQHPDGPLGGMREALAKGDVTLAQRILLGYNATGADYRAFLATIYGALAHRYPDQGHQLLFANAAATILDMADWGGNMPAFISWFPPLMMDSAPDTPAAQAARAYAGAKEHDLSWLRTRLSIPKEEAAGAEFQRALVSSDANAACDATLAALRSGASAHGVAGAMTMAAARLINVAPASDRAALVRAGHTLLYTHAVRMAMAQEQEVHVWPMLYTAAAVVNAASASGASLPVEGPGGRAPISAPMGGTLAPTMLQSVEEQLGQGDMASALSTAQRYLQVGHPVRALAGVIGTVAAQRETRGDAEATHVMPMVAAALGSYQRLPLALQGGGQNPLLAAALRLVSELGGTGGVGERVRAAISARVGGA